MYLLFTLYKSKRSPPELLHPKRPLGFREDTTTAYRFILLYFLSQHLLISYLYLAYMASAQRYFCKLLPFLMSEDILRAAVRVHPVTQKGEDHEFHLLKYTSQACSRQPPAWQPWNKRCKRLEMTSLKTKIHKIIKCLYFMSGFLIFQLGKTVGLLRWVKQLAGNQGNRFPDYCLETISFWASKQIILSFWFLWTTSQLFLGGILNIHQLVQFSHQV